MPPKRTPPKKTRDPLDDEDIRAALDPGRRRQPDPSEEDAEDKLIAMLQKMMHEQEERQSIRMERFENAIKNDVAKEIEGWGKRFIPVVPEGAHGGAVGGADAVDDAAAGAAAGGSMVKVPATTLTPPTLEFLSNPAKFDVWMAAWTAYLENSGVMSITNAVAKKNRMRSLLQQAFDSDMGSWVMSQTWFDDETINGDHTRVLERIRAKLEKEANPRKEFAALMQRKWKRGESVDDFWIDIQRQVKYCGLRDRYHVDHTLATLWICNFNDPDAEKEFALRPNITAEECYQLAKGLEQMRQQRKGDFPSVNVVRQSAYKQGGGKNAAKVTGKGASGGSNSGGGKLSGQKSGAGPRAARTASCLNCGFDSHRNGVCPAQGQECKACGTVGHYARHCPAGRVNAVDDGEEIRVCNAIQIQEEDEDEAEEIVNKVSKPPAARSTQGRDWQEAEFEIGNRCEVRNGDKWVAGTITGSYVLADGPRVCAVLIDETDEIWKATTDSIVIRKRCEKGQWVPIKRPVNGRGPR
jgi:hypothetical protein